MITEENFNYLMNVIVGRAAVLETALGKAAAENQTLKSENVQLKAIINDKADTAKAVIHSVPDKADEETPKKEDTDEDNRKV